MRSWDFVLLDPILVYPYSECDVERLRRSRLMDLKIEALLTVDLWAAKVGIKPSTARAWLLRRKIAHVRVGKRAVRIPISEAERIIREGYVPAREPR